MASLGELGPSSASVCPSDHLQYDQAGAQLLGSAEGEGWDGFASGCLSLVDACSLTGKQHRLGADNLG